MRGKITSLLDPKRKHKKLQTFCNRWDSVVNKIKTQSQIGWVHFSRDALRKVEAHLKEEQEGVRDEVGFLLLHQAYADRFFPGTSVLQTRLRYVFFVPWIYIDLMRSFRRGDFDQELSKKEVELTRRLMHNDEGVIGKRIYPRPTAQPASFIYWTALGTWGFLKKLHDESLPSRSFISRVYSSKRIAARFSDDDGEPLDNQIRIFSSLPAPPDLWDKHNAKLSFRLRTEEKDFLIKHLIVLPSGSDNTRISLLAKLVENKINVTRLKTPWKTAILAVASKEDKQALIRAKSTAALAAIGRGVYAAMVESAMERDGLETDRFHRVALKELVNEYKDEALKLNIKETLMDFPELKGKNIMTVLRDTKDWLKEGGKNPERLRICYEAAEFARKGSVRVKLPNTPHAKERRREWSLNKDIRKKSEPLHYRWKNVRRLLMDLQGDA